MEWTEKTPFRYFPDNKEGDIWVFPKCPNCGRFIVTGEVYTNEMGNVKLENWVCRKCGEIQPEYIRE